MQKWEYCVLGLIKDMNRDGLVGYYPRVVFFGLNGIDKNVSLHHEENEQFNIAKAIAQLGMEGWELVGTGDTTAKHVIYFKRLIE